ncbi:hypothetical protein [Nitrosomonas oligotropha]|uniref:hypothetical protein n=1 Tax=Nitrosomonas oligotropha TaxID=42354 RepID=UPI0015E7596E|nr:hypothetical protein [Nitrosomonas oligotropha]
MPKMRLGQTAVTQRFGIEPTRLTVEGALHNVPDFRDQALLRCNCCRVNGLFLAALY